MEYTLIRKLVLFALWDIIRGIANGWFFSLYFITLVHTFYYHNIIDILNTRA